MWLHKPPEWLGAAATDDSVKVFQEMASTDLAQFQRQRSLLGSECSRESVPSNISETLPLLHSGTNILDRGTKREADLSLLFDTSKWDPEATNICGAALHTKADVLGVLLPCADSSGRQKAASTSKNLSLTTLSFSRA